MHVDYGLLEYMRRDAESLTEPQPWVTERTTGADSTIDVQEGGYLLRTGATAESRAELQLPPLLDTTDPLYEVVAVEVDVQALTREGARIALGLHANDGTTRLEWRNERTEPLVVVDDDAITVEAPGREIDDAYRHVHRLEFDRPRQVLRHYVDGCRSAEIGDASVLPDEGGFQGIFVSSSEGDQPTEAIVRRISHVAGKRRGPG